MELRTLLNKLALPLFALLLFFAITTFLAFLTQDAHWNRFLGLNWHRIFQLLDMRQEESVGTWFSSILFLTTALSFILLGWGKFTHLPLSSPTRLIFRLTAIGACVISADEVGGIHETVGKRLGQVINQAAQMPIDEKGFSWILLFAPVALACLAWLGYSLRQLIVPLASKQRNQLYILLWTALLLLPSVFFWEALAGYFDYQRLLAEKELVFLCFEETSEVLGMYCLFLTATMLAKVYRL